ncbi:unnamed protein product [Aphanomyces euteiches]
METSTIHVEKRVALPPHLALGDEKFQLRICHPHHRLPSMDQYHIERTIADALYGQVILARDAATNTLVAIKKMHKSIAGIAKAIATESQTNHLLNAHGGHDNVLRMRAHITHDEGDHLVFDYCAGGDLFDLVSHGPLEFPVARRYFRQLVHAIVFLHTHGVAHRDLSLENVLLDNDRLVVCDFGLAASATAVCHDKVGKDFYMAPEVAEGIPYNPTKADVWSLGIILFMLLTSAPVCQAPVPTDARYAYFSQHGLRDLLSSWFMKIDDLAVDLLEHMLEPNQVKRWSIDRVRAHPYVNEGDSAMSALGDVVLEGVKTFNATSAWKYMNRLFKKQSAFTPAVASV